MCCFAPDPEHRQSDDQRNHIPNQRTHANDQWKQRRRYRVWKSDSGSTFLLSLRALIATSDIRCKWSDGKW